MRWYQKVRKLPEKRKKLVLWIIIVFLGLVLLFFWARTTVYRFNNLSETNSESIIKIPESGGVWTDIEKFWKRQDLENMFPDELIDIPIEESFYQENNE